MTDWIRRFDYSSIAKETMVFSFDDKIHNNFLIRCLNGLISIVFPLINSIYFGFESNSFDLRLIWCFLSMIEEKLSILECDRILYIDTHIHTQIVLCFYKALVLSNVH